MLAQFALSKIECDGEVLYDRVRFIYLNGVAAVWSEDLDTRTLTRLARIEGVVFERRHSARRAHTLVFKDGSPSWSIWPIHSGACGSCGSRVASYSYDELISPDLETIG